MNWVDWIIFGITGTSVLAGLSRGAVRTVFSIVGLVVGFVIAVRESGALGMVLAEWIPERAAPAVGFVLIFLGIALAFTLTAWLLRKVMKGLSLSWLDRLLGGGLGFLRAAAILGILALAVEGSGPLPATSRSITFPYALEAGRILLNLIPEETLERLDWTSLRGGMIRPSLRPENREDII